MGREVLGWRGDPAADALALRFAGGLHALVLVGTAPGLATVYPGAAGPAGMADGERSWAAIVSAIDAHAGHLLAFLEHPPQTNEVARAAVLFGGLASVARDTGRPLVLLELGASAGLNLHLDAFAHTLGDATFGPSHARVRLAPRWTGPSPPRRRS